METLLLYLLKSGALIALFFVAYHFLLRKETFFKTNRWFLLSGLVTSISLPLVTFKKIIWVEPLRVAPMHWDNLPVNMVVQPQPETFEVDWIWVAIGIYAIGIIIFLFRFVFDFGGLLKVLKGKTVTQQADFKFVDISEQVSPFSYFNYIVYNSSMYTENELENILEHEKVHCEQHHSVDVLIARIFSIVFWYNPFVWLYQKAILQNLEFIADSDALKNISDKKAYQITLLKVTTHDHCVSITNHFYQSLIKKRIIMLNKNQSKQSNLWKYLLIIPALAAFLFYFQVKVIAQEKNSPEIFSKLTGEPVNIVINKNTTDAELAQHSQRMKEQHNVKLKFSKVKRNSNGEITAIKAEYKDKDGHKGTYVISGDEAIKPVSIYRKDNGSISFGNSAPKIHIFKKENDVAEADGEDPEAPEAPESPEEPEDAMAYSFDIPELPEMPELESLKDLNGNLNVQTFTGKDGKVTVIVNGEKIEVDPEKILADIDIEKIKDEALQQADNARKQIRVIRPEMRKAKRMSEDARRQSEDAREEMMKAREEMEQSREALEEARRQLEESRRELEHQKSQARKSKTNK